MSTPQLILATFFLAWSGLAVASTPSPVGTKQAWQSEGGAWKGQVKSKATVVVMDADADPRIVWSVGTEAKLACTIYSEPVDPAQFLLDWTGDILSRKSALTKQSIGSVSAGELHGFPYLSLSTDYIEGKARLLKTYLIDLAAGAIACSHDEPGHGMRILGHLDYFVKHIEIPYNLTLRKTHRVFLIEVDGKPVGFEQQTVRRAPESKLMDTRRASLLIPRGPGLFIPVDKATVETLAFNGVLLQHRMVTRSAGQTHRFEIQTKDTEAYTGTADLNGNTMPIQFKVPSHSLMGVRTASSALAQKIAQQSERRPITLSVYNAAINHRGPTNHVATLTSKLKDGGLMLEESYGPQSRKTTRTKKGHLLTATSALGPVTMKMSRIFSKDYPRPKK